MPETCNICLNTQNKATNVRVVIFNDGEVVNLSDMLKDLLLLDFPNCYLKICEECREFFLSYVSFKKRIFNHRKPLLRRLAEVRNSINEFLVNTSENIVLMSHDRSLILVPASQELSMRNQLSPKLNQQQSQQNKSELKAEPEDKYLFSVEEDNLLVELHKSSQCEIVNASTELKICEIDEFDKIMEVEPTTLEEKMPAWNAKIKVEPCSSSLELEPVDPLKVNTVMSKYESDSDESFISYSPKRKKSKDNKSRTLIGTKKETRELLENMTPEQEKSLSKNISQSKIRNSSMYSCFSCFKLLSSYASIRYHIFSAHLLPQDETKSWVKSRLQEAKKFQQPNVSSSNLKWRCVECSRIFNSRPSLRYHLKRHLDEQKAGTVEN